MFQDRLQEVGYQNFDFKVLNQNLSISEQLYMQGYAEAILSQDYIFDYYINAQEDNQYQDDYTNQTKLYPPQKMIDFANYNIEYIRQQVSQNRKDTYWQTVNGTLSYLEGLSQVLMKKNYTMSLNMVFCMNAISDYESLSEKWEAEANAKGEIFRVVTKRPDHTHCTGLVYVPEDASDIFVSQVTWTSWKSGFNKINKNVQLIINNIPRMIQYSSYPGQLNSVDDFYQILSNQTRDAVIETTYNLWNESTYQYMTYQSVLTFMRTQVANYLHTTSEEWISIFMSNCSFTYNNNWVIIDFLKWEKNRKQCSKQPYKCLTTNGSEIVWSLEPTNKLSTSYVYDATHDLFQNKFFASLNAPINANIANFYGYDPDNVYYSYNKSRRLATLTQELGPDATQQYIKTFDDFKVFMRQNLYMVDEKCKEEGNGTCSNLTTQNDDPREGLSSRYDLCDEEKQNCQNWSGWSINDTEITYNGPSPFGATDSKSTSNTLSKQFKFNYVYGPTHGVQDPNSEYYIPSPDLQSLCDGIQGIANEYEKFWAQDVFEDIYDNYCENRDKYCNKCDDKSEENYTKQTCELIDFTGIIIAYSITLAIIYLILIALLVVYFIFMKKSNDATTIDEN